jgi:YggT family protein
MVEGFAALVELTIRTVSYLVTAAVVVVVVLMALRWILLRSSPFGWASYQVRRLTDPMVWPLTQMVPSQGMASLLVVLITLLGAYFLKQVVEEVLVSLLGLVTGLAAGSPVSSLGWLLYAAVSVFLLLIVMRIVISWVPFARDGRLVWVLHSLTEPVMAPFRQMIPPLGMFDLSPIILILLLSFVKGAIRNLLIQ